jgi:TolB-like protein
MKTICVSLKFSLLLVLFVAAGVCSTLVAQTRVAVLPFRNTNGYMEYNERCYQIADSVSLALQKQEKEHSSFVMVPVDSVMEVLSSLNLDPINPQYESDMWKAAELLHVDRVVTGTFNVKYNKIFINAFVYSVATKLSDSAHEARSVYKPYEKTFEAIPTIVTAILPAVAKQ